MRRQAKASTAGSTRHKATAVLVAVVALGAVLLAAAPSLAATVTDRPLLFSFDATDTPAGHFVKPTKIAIDNSTGYVYVAEGQQGPEWILNEAISKFNPDGTAADFSATGSPTLFGSPPFVNRPGIAVDNSGGPNQSRLYVSTKQFGIGGTNRLIAYSPSGEIIWQLDPGGPPEDVAVDGAGHPYLLFSSSIKEYANTGSPPAQIASFPIGSESGVNQGSFDVDASGNIYIARFSGVKKYVGGVLSSTLDAASSTDVYVDQSSPGGHIFTDHDTSPSSFNEYDAGGALIGTFGAGLAVVPGSGGGIAFRPSLDRVYVSDGGPEAVDAFGPAATGTVPDPTIEATTGIGVAKATLHGTINPQGVANAYYFEWSSSAQGEFAQSFRSPLQSLPEDSSPHAVTYEPNNLFGNKNHRARLVAVNTASGLRNVSGKSEFKTLKASASPLVTIAQPSAMTTAGAHIAGTINPKEDSVTWEVRLSTDAACASGFTTAAIRVLPGGGVNTPVSIETDLNNLLPAQHYCARIRATNSFGEVTSETKEFSTLAVPPSEVEAAFVAPRTDTTAQLNGLIDPEGEADVTYHFELSEDGVNWTVLPDRESSLDARKQIVVADEVSGLSPNTTYHYRLAAAENSGGPAASVGAFKTFATRTTAEMDPPKRGIELVNNPDKGVQNLLSGANVPALPSGGISTDGERALWYVSAGAPGAPNGAFSTFLAERTSSGWHSHSIAPPAAQQVGGGERNYLLDTANPDFSQFVLEAIYSPSFGRASEAARVRVDTQQHQDLLREYSWTGSEADEPAKSLPDLTDNGSHVLEVNATSDQLEDIGSGTPEVISVMPNGTESSCGLLTGASFFGGGSSTPVGSSDGAAREWRPGYHRMEMTDASLVYFEAKPNGECGKPWGLYVRDREAETTTLIDPGTGARDVAIVRATPDGRHAFFATASQLDPADENGGYDLYRWDLDSGEASCLSCVVPDAGIERLIGNHEVLPIVISDDFSHAYFESERQLVSGRGAAGQRNVYALSGNTIEFVATAVGRDGLPVLSSNSAPQLSTNGEVLVFSAQPTPGLTADTTEVGAGRPELYLHDDGEDSLECVSCAHDGTTTNGIETNGSVALLSADGSTVALVTQQALDPFDVNGTADVYEWRNGARRLVSNGVTEFPEGPFVTPAVQGIDADGSNVLFSLIQPGLTGFEEDKLLNLYDARIGGGFPPPSPPVHCDGDSCQGPLAAAPVPGSSSSATYGGRGNLGPQAKKRRPCARKRGKAKQRCISRHKRHRKHARAQGNSGRTK